LFEKLDGVALRRRLVTVTWGVESDDGVVVDDAAVLPARVIRLPPPSVGHQPGGPANGAR
jgi:hypothetical protein